MKFNHFIKMLLLLPPFYSIGAADFSDGSPSFSDLERAQERRFGKQESTAFWESDGEDSIDLEMHKRLDQQESIRYEMALSVAHPKARKVVRVLNDKKERVRWKNCCLALFGIPGAGKSTLAEAIAYKANWNLETITNSEVEKEGRASTSIEIKRRLNEIAKDGKYKKKKTVIFLDEFNILVKNHNDKHHDTDRNFTTFNRYFNKLEKERNYNVFCILAMNRFSDLPESMQQRLSDVVCEVTNLSDPAKIRDCFDIGLIDSELIVPQEARDYLSHKLNGFNFNNPRDIAKITSVITNVAFFEEERPVTLTQNHIDDAFKDWATYLKAKTDNKDDVSDEDRRHREMMQAHEAHFREQLRVSEVHFRESQSTVRNQCNVTVGTGGVSVGAPITAIAAGSAYAIKSGAEVLGNVGARIDGMFRSADQNNANAPEEVIRVPDLRERSERIPEWVHVDDVLSRDIPFGSSSSSSSIGSSYSSSGSSSSVGSSVSGSSYSSSGSGRGRGGATGGDRGRGRGGRGRGRGGNNTGMWAYFTSFFYAPAASDSDSEEKQKNN